MTDRSNIIRHPDIVINEFTSIMARIATARGMLEEANQELDQVSAIAYEMMDAARQTGPARADMAKAWDKGKAAGAKDKNPYRGEQTS